MKKLALLAALAVSFGAVAEEMSSQERLTMIEAIQAERQLIREQQRNLNYNRYGRCMTWHELAKFSEGKGPEFEALVEEFLHKNAVDSGYESDFTAECAAVIELVELEIEMIINRK